MAGQGSAETIFGTAEPVAEEKWIRLGNLAFLLNAEAIRAISWKGVEVVRAISWPVRDPSWVTLQQHTDYLSIDRGEREVSCSLAFSVADGDLDCALAVKASADGTLRVELSMTAATDFRTNRAGFTVLHPISGIAGSGLSIRHSDGSLETTAFPEFVRPDQPAMDIVGMSHAVAGVDVELTFGGEVFEMEDQRNWTDASYKTYCVPLVYPFTYTIPAGQTVKQSISLALSGERDGSANAAGADRISVREAGEVFPQIGLAVEPGWIGEPDLAVLSALGEIRNLQARLPDKPEAGYLTSLARLRDRLDAEIDAEIVIPAGSEPSAVLAGIAEALDEAGLQPARVMALPETYLSSYQPSGPWPDGPTPAEAAREARKAFPNARIGGGVLTNFTELNRCRPQAGAFDYITHGTTAIVHAADDRSVIETLEALPQVFASGQKLSDGKPYRLGLVSIGMRSNPYGADVAPNPENVRQTMARNDPRQAGLFAAAWAVGAIGAAAESGIAALSPSALTGPFGIQSDDEPVRVSPLAHVVCFAAKLSANPAMALDGLPAGVRGFSAGLGGRVRCALSNLGAAPATIALGELTGLVRILDVTSVAQAAGSPDWLDVSGASRITGSLVLDPFAIAFADLES